MSQIASREACEHMLYGIFLQLQHVGLCVTLLFVVLLCDAFEALLQVFLHVRILGVPYILTITAKERNDIRGHVVADGVVRSSETIIVI